MVGRSTCRSQSGLSAAAAPRHHTNIRTTVTMRSLLLLLFLGATQCSALFGRRPLHVLMRPASYRRGDPSFESYRRASSAPFVRFRSNGTSNKRRIKHDDGFGRDDDDDDFDDERYGKTRQEAESSSQAERALLEKAGIRPFKMKPPPKPGQSSLTSKLITANVLCYALQVWKPGLTKWGAKRSDLILQGKDLHRLITPVFLHGNIIHLLMNSYSLNAIGPQIEQTFGSGRFLATYLASGIAGNLMSTFMSPNPAVGASGAVFGLLGAHYIFLNQNDGLLGSYARQGTARITETVATNVIYGLMNPMIDNWGHLGGCIGGAAMAYNFGPKLFVLGFPDGRRTVVDQPRIRLPRQYESFFENIRNKFQGRSTATLSGKTYFHSDAISASDPLGYSSKRRLPRTAAPSSLKVTNK